MAFISVKHLSIDFKVYGVNSQSLKRQLLHKVVGSRVTKDVNNSVVVKALKDISLEIKEGDRLGLVGHNGAGKSTFLRVLAGIYKPTKGCIQYQGKMNALLGSSFCVDPESTGLENIYLGGYLLGMKKHEVNAKLNTIVEFTDLGDFLQLPIKTYSTGMLSRLNFLLLISTDPEILLIDESIDASDKVFFKKAMSISGKLWNKAKISILASHNMDILKLFANELIYFKKGEIVGREKLKKK